MKHKPATLGAIDPALRALRLRAQRTFESLWCNGDKLTHSEACAWLREALDLQPHETHIDTFSAGQCEWLIREIEDGRPLESRL